MSNSSVRDALVTSVACVAPPVSRQIRKLSTVPNASWPASARRAQAGDVVEHPADLRRREVRVEHQAGARAQRRLVPRRLQLGAQRRGAPVLPDDRVADGPAVGAVPEQRRLALVGDADGGDARRVDALQRVAERAQSPTPRSPRDRARPRPGAGRSGRTRGTRARARCAPRRAAARSSPSSPGRWRESGLARRWQKYHRSPCRAARAMRRTSGGQPRAGRGTGSRRR